MSVIVSNFVPKRRLISNVTNDFKAVVTTTEDHGYLDGAYVRVIVPLAYGMNLNYVQTTITVLSGTTFQTTINTLGQLPYVTPTFPPAFTQAQVVPITGEEDNIAR